MGGGARGAGKQRGWCSWRGERVERLRGPSCFMCGVAGVVVEANFVSLSLSPLRMNSTSVAGVHHGRTRFPWNPRRQTSNPSFESEARRSPPSLLSEWVCWIVFRVKKKLTLAGELGFYFVFLYFFFFLLKKFCLLFFMFGGNLCCPRWRC